MKIFQCTSILLFALSTLASTAHAQPCPESMFPYQMVVPTYFPYDVVIRNDLKPTSLKAEFSLSSRVLNLSNDGLAGQSEVIASEAYSGSSLAEGLKKTALLNRQILLAQNLSASLSLTQSEQLWYWLRVDTCLTNAGPNNLIIDPGQLDVRALDSHGLSMAVLHYQGRLVAVQDFSRTFWNDRNLRDKKVYLFALEKRTAMLTQKKLRLLVAADGQVSLERL